MQAIRGRPLLVPVLACLAVLAVSAQSAVLTVNPQDENTFQTIQDALDAAESGDTVQLADATYTGDGNCGLEFDGKTITLCSMNGPANCFMDCPSEFIAFSIKGALRGITIIGGHLSIDATTLTMENCIFDGPNCSLYISQCRPTIVNCTFRNLVGDDGGAISCEGADPVIRGCIFENNSASQDGGAIHNRASSPTIIGCRFVNNSCEDDGGAIANYDRSCPVLVGCTFERNRSNDNGGAIFSRSNSSPWIISCVFAGNHARSNGGAIYSRENAARIVNSVFSGNVARDDGGVLYCTEEDDRATLVNCTLVGNSAELQGGVVYSERAASLLNCILWENRDGDGNGQDNQFFPTAPILRHCCMQNWTGQDQSETTNHDREPQFADADGTDNVSGNADDDFRLTADSPCVDAGFDAPVSDPFLTDCAGYPRLMGETTDMGAYEYAPPDELAAMAPAPPGWEDESVVVNEARTYQHYDWVELHNVTDRTIHIGGWLLSDRKTPGWYEIAPGTSIEPHGYLVLYEDQHFGNPADPGCHEPFALRREGDTVYLESAHGGLLTGQQQEQVLEYVAYIEGSNTLGRHIKSDGTVDFVRLSAPTPGAANAYPWVGPVVISEIMCDRTGSSVGDQYIELHNTTDQVASPLTLEVDGQVVVNLAVPARSRVLIMVDPSAVQRWAYGPIPADVGVYSGLPALNWPIGSILLRHSNVIADRVVYSDGRRHWNFPGGVDPWPVRSPETLPSLTRTDPTLYGNDPNSWQAAPPSPGN